MDSSSYATKEESASLMGIDSRTPAEKELDAMIEAELEGRHYDPMSYSYDTILRRIAIRLIEGRKAP